MVESFHLIKYLLAKFYVRCTCTIELYYFVPQKLTMTSSSTSAWREKRRQRRRRSPSPDDETKLLDSKLGSSANEKKSNDYVPFVSTAKRLRMEREAAILSATTSADGGHDISASAKGSARSRKLLAAIGGGTSTLQNNINGDGANDSAEENDKPSQDQTHARDEKGKESDEEYNQQEQVRSLLDEASALQSKHADLTAQERENLSKQTEEARILREASKVQTNALQAASELAKGVTYTEPFRTTWKPPRYILEEGAESWVATRKKWHILVESTDPLADKQTLNPADCPPPIKTFEEMKFPKPIIDALNAKNIKRPTPIQMQGLPVALAGRDMVGIAFTGSGKTMTFSLPLVIIALEEEMRMPLVGGEGPLGFILAPSRELARQTFDVVKHFCDVIKQAEGYPELRAQLLIGGENAREQSGPIKKYGVHCIVATPGRMKDFLKRKTITLDVCRYICLDEADRMLDLGFDEEVGEIMNHFKHQRQTLLFSATFPQKFQDFAKSTLVKPIVVNVGRAGAANLDVIQEVEYVKQEAKIVYLLECLQKTAPPVVIFCERKGDVDDIHEYLLLKGVDAVSIHGGKDQEERNEAIQLYKEGKKDVLVATDIAAKGLDFSDIQHVINFDMPSEIENYVHRIGRTVSPTISTFYCYVRHLFF